MCYFLLCKNNTVVLEEISLGTINIDLSYSLFLYFWRGKEGIRFEGVEMEIFSLSFL